MPHFRVDRKAVDQAADFLHRQKYAKAQSFGMVAPDPVEGPTNGSAEVPWFPFLQIMEARQDHNEEQSFYNLFKLKIYQYSLPWEAWKPRIGAFRSRIIPGWVSRTKRSNGNRPRRALRTLAKKHGGESNHACLVFRSERDVCSKWLGG